MTTQTVKFLGRLLTNGTKAYGDHASERYDEMSKKWKDESAYLMKQEEGEDDVFVSSRSGEFSPSRVVSMTAKNCVTDPAIVLPLAKCAYNAYKSKTAVSTLSVLAGTGTTVSLGTATVTASSATLGVIGLGTLGTVAAPLTLAVGAGIAVGGLIEWLLD